MMVSPLLADDADTVDVFGDDLDGGLCLTFADGGGLQGLLLGGGVPFRLHMARALHPAEANQRDSQGRDGQPAVRPRNQVHGVSPRHWWYSACRLVASPPHRRALEGLRKQVPNLPNLQSGAIFTSIGIFKLPMPR